MSTLIEQILEAHGGLRRWNSLTKVELSIVSGGKLFDLQGQPQDGKPRKLEIYLHEQRLSMTPYGGPDKKTNFTPERIAIESLGGQVLSERKGSVSELHNHMQGGEWDALDRAYFNGYANWTYLATPFFMAMPGVQCSELPTHPEFTGGWKAIRVNFPPEMATHSAVQDLYFDKDLRLRRHDYLIDVAGHFHAAQYVHDYATIDGIRLPTKRRASKRGENHQPIKEELMVHIDYSDIHYS